MVGRHDELLGSDGLYHSLVAAGERFGAGSARDWAAKVTRLLGVRAVLAVSFERIHRTNLVALGVLPVECSALRDFDPDHAVEFDVLGVDGGHRSTRN